MAEMQEKEYRRLVDETFEEIDAAFADVDPDLAESSLSQGTLTIVFRGTTRFILSPQAPVRQIWAAFRDRAWHFDFHSDGRRWLDDRGRGVELYRLVEEITRGASGLEVKLPGTSPNPPPGQ